MGERLRSENANMTTELGKRRALLMPCRSNIENIPQTTRRLFDTSMLDSVAKRLRETKQSWVNPQSLCDSESAFQKTEEVPVPIASTPALLKSPRSSQKQDDDMSDCQSELEPWSPRLDVASLFGAGYETSLFEN